MNKKKILMIITALIIVLIIGVLIFQNYGKVSFGGISDENIDSNEEITHINISTWIDTIGDTLWTKIEDPELITQLITEHSDIKLKKEFRKDTRNLENEMTIHTKTGSYSFKFDNNFFAGSNRDYKVLEGNFVSAIHSLGDLEWVTTKEFAQ